MHEGARIALYAIVAAASPTALLATLAVLSSKRGRLKGILFMVGFLISQTVAFVVVYVAGSASTSSPHRLASAWVELAAGVAVIVISVKRPKLKKPKAPASSARTQALLERLKGVTPAVSLGIGALLGIGAKRLAITIIAAGTLAVSEAAPASTFWLGLLYVLVATVIVWFPVVYSAILGRRAEDLVARVRSSTERRGHGRASLVGGVVGALLVADALTRLFGSG